MNKVWFGRVGDTLVHTDADSLKVIRRIEEGEAVPFKPLRPRSLQWHRRYWLMISRFSEHITEFDISLDERVKAPIPIGSPEDLHIAIKLVTGHCHTSHVSGSRYIVRVPKPTDFESMTADEWAEYYPKVLDCLHARALPQIKSPWVEEELARLAS